MLKYTLWFGPWCLIPAISYFKASFYGYQEFFLGCLHLNEKARHSEILLTGAATSIEHPGACSSMGGGWGPSTYAARNRSRSRTNKRTSSPDYQKEQRNLHSAWGLGLLKSFRAVICTAHSHAGHLFPTTGRGCFNLGRQTERGRMGLGRTHSPHAG